MRILLTTFFAITFFGLRAQSGSDSTVIGDPNTIYDVVDVAPEPIGGMKSFYQTVMRNIKYPKDARMSGTTGRVIVQFVVEKNGEILGENLKVIRSVSESLDEEARRVVLTTSPWQPAMNNGNPVRSRRALPITFNLFKPPPPTK